MTKNKHTFLLLLGSLFFMGCSYTKYVPENQYLLWESAIKIEDGGRAKAEAEAILKQSPNSTLLSFRPSLGLYSWGDGTDSSFFGNLGNPPVLLDTSKIERGAQQLQNYYFNKGYFLVSGSYELSAKANSQKAKAKYLITRGPRYTVDSISYNISTPEMQDLVNYFANDSELEVDKYYDSDLLDKERNRLKTIFKNRGYYDFALSFISYKADTNNRPKPHSVWIELTIANRSKRVGDSIINLPHKKHIVNSVTINPDFSFLDNNKADDTVIFNTYKLAFDTLNYKPRYLTDAIHFKEGDQYSQSVVQETYSHLSSYNAFKLTEITFKSVPIKSDTGAQRLNAVVKLSPRPKFSFDPQVEATNTSNNLGVSGSLGLIDRNVFKGGEELRLDLSSGLEYQPTVGNANNLSRTFELGSELSLKFPRFLLPFNTVGLLKKRMQPSSTFGLYANRTSRIEFERETFGSRLSYAWRESPQKAWQVDLLSLAYSNLFAVQRRFLDQLNPIQQLAFRSEFISSTAATFTYNGQKDEKQKTYNFFKIDGELAGTILSQFAPTDNLSDSLGVPIYQFAQAEVDYRHYWNLGKKRVWAQRFSLGYVLPFGVSSTNQEGDKLRIPPFSRFFFLGGSNDLRAWPAYRAGGGSSRVTSYRGTPQDSSGFAIGTFKIIMSSEYRFTIYGSLKGALFIDAGNIWLTGGLERDLPETQFEIGDLFTDLYVGTGFGLRLDLDFFVLRFDTGIKVRDPGLVSDNREWVIATKPVIPNFTYNIALGYPF